MSDRRNTGGVMSAIDVAATAAALGSKESPKFKAKMDDIWGSEENATSELAEAIDGNNDAGAAPAAHVAAVKPQSPVVPAAVPAGKEPVATPADDTQAFRPPLDVMPKNEAPDPVEAAPDATVAPEEDLEDTPPEDISSNPKQLNAWTKIRAEKKDLKLENIALKQQIEAAKTSSTQEAVTARISELESQVNSYEEKLGQYDVTQTAAFADKYTNPLVTRYRRMVALLSKNGDAAAADALARQLIDPNANRDELISGHPITTQAALGAILVEVDDLQGQRDEAIKNWRETKAVLSEQEARQGITSLNKSITEDTNKAIEALRLEGNYLYMLSQSDDNWNAAVKDRIAALQGTLKTGSKEDMVKLVADGLTARMYREWYEKEHTRAEKLASQINAKLRSAPNLGGSSGAPIDGPSKPAKPRPMSSVLNSVWGDDEKF